MLRARGVRSRAGGRDILSDVDLTVGPGELLALVGPNGAGKSTLLSLLAGDRKPTGGKVLLDDRPLESWSARDLARRRAVLPQHHQVHFSFTVAQVLEMGRSPWPPSEQDARLLHTAAGEAAVDHLLERSVSSLSGGEQARTHLARVLVQDTPLLLLDEPTAALDLHHQESVLHLVRSRAEQGRTVVVVLHDLDLAAAYATRVCLLAEGRLVADGPPDAVLNANLLSSVYGHAVEVIRHPVTGRTVVLPVRPGVGGAVDCAHPAQRGRSSLGGSR